MFYEDSRTKIQFLKDKYRKRIFDFTNKKYYIQLHV